MDVLKTEGLSFVYSKGTPFERLAVRQVSFTVQKGERLGIIGHTGSGKSTLIQMLNGLIRPTSGRVYLNGVNIWDEPKKIRDIRFKIGMVFQYPEYQLFEETALKDIMFGPRNMGLNDQEAEERARLAAKFTGLKEELLHKNPFALSGGEKRRVAIAGVIAMDPEILILDEPTAGLDPRGRDVLLAQIMEYQNQTKNTLILVSHSMEDIGRMADRILVMNKGGVAILDKPEAVFRSTDILREAGLIVPQVTQIMLELKARGLPVDENALTIETALRQLIPLMRSKEG